MEGADVRVAAPVVEMVGAAAVAFAAVELPEGWLVAPVALWQEVMRVALRAMQCIGQWKMVSGKGE